MQRVGFHCSHEQHAPSVNEHITDEPWPSKPERRERLRECVDVMHALLSGETVTHQGRIRVREAKLYSRPRAVPPLVGAAKLREMIDAFRQGGDKPVYVQVACAYAPSDADAEQLQVRCHLARYFDAATHTVTGHSSCRSQKLELPLWLAHFAQPRAVVATICT